MCAKSSQMGVARFFFLLWMMWMCTERCSAQEDRPDVTMLYKDYYQTCIAGSNTNGYGLAFMSKYLSENSYVTDFEYLDTTGATINLQNNCDFEDGRSCNNRWTTSSLLNLVKPLTYPIIPIIDERWTKFPVHRTNGLKYAAPKYDKIVQIAEGYNFFVSFSIRGTQDAQIVLCEQKYALFKYTPCYWLIIDGFENQQVTAIRKCQQGIPDTYADKDDCRMRRQNSTGHNKLLNESKWTHFTLAWLNKNRIRLSVWDTNDSETLLLDYIDEEDPLQLKLMSVRTYNAITDWKIHEYQFLYVKQPSDQRLISLGPHFSFATSSSICINLHVIMCNRCAMDIILERTDDGTTVTRTIQGHDSTSFYMKWQNVKLENGISHTDLYYYRLHLNLRTTGTEGGYTFWGIDDIRMCSHSEIRRGAIYNKNKHQCYSLNYPNWSVKFGEKTDFDNAPPVCRDGRYIGGFCNIKCSNVTDSCSQYQICAPTENEQKGRCSCVAGYTWESSCKNSCKKGFYGYDCQNECGKCKNSDCYINTGKCKMGCEEGYQPPFCQNASPRFVVAPEVTKIFFTSITIELKNKTIEGSDDGEYFLIEYKEADSQSDWRNYSKMFNLDNKDEIDITDLTKETSYLIRAIIYTKNGFAYRNDNLPTTSVTTNCKVEREIPIQTKSRSVTVSFTTLEDSCSLRNYFIELKKDSESIEKQYVTTENFEFGYLKPYTNYEIVITNKIYPNYIERKPFQTEEDAPESVQDLQLLEAKNTEIIVSWSEPEETNGVIKQYLVSYKLIQRTACSNRIIHEDKLTVYPFDISRVAISALQPYSTYYVSVVAENTFKGKEKGQYFQTVMSDVISNEEVPENIFVSELSSRSVQIGWQKNCTKNQGPLLFDITIKCINNDWCPLISDIVLNDISSTNSGITTYDLTPYTNYTVDLRAKRTENGQVTSFGRTTTFSAPAGNPPSVKNFKIYSKDKSSISVRWQDPYPPHGHLESYTIKYCYNTYDYSCKYKITNVNDLVLCNLWAEEFYCNTLPNLYTNVDYKITITAKNQESKLPGNSTTFNVITAEGVPSAPLNLSRFWENNIMNLYWNHPDIPNGQIKRFVIILEQNGTELTNQDNQTNYEFSYNITAEEKYYTYEIQKSYRYSSSYLLTIYAVNSLFSGDKATLHIDTPPETPLLEGEIKVNEELNSNTTITIIIPEVQANTKSQNSFLYIVVSKVSSITKRQAEEEINIKQDILNHSNDPQSAWVAKEINLNKPYPKQITLGTGETMQSEILNEELNDQMLEPSSSYEFSLVLISMYRQQRSIQSYQRNIRTKDTPIPPSSGALYALLLLFLLPVIAYFVYRYAFKKEMKRTSMMMIPGLRGVRTEDPHDPDVIPLTEAASEPAQEVKSKPKKPAVVSKPSTSAVQQENPEPAEINNTGTNFFHSRIILLENLENYLKEALENGDLDEQHALFPRGQTKPWNYGILKPNKFKNRYNNLIAYDKNRVKLDKISNDQYSDYINASYINGYRQEKAYIATQGPKLATVNDFWRMIWQEKVRYIVMLANVVEAGKKKCEKYWPEIDSSREYGNVTVYFEKSEVYADYEYRTFDLNCKGETRKLTQLHFTSWPDHGVPLYPQSLVPFLKKMLTIRQSTAPVVVHCSAGVGRTGTVILCDICLRMAAREKAIDVLRYLHEIREQRANMVDNIDQYKLVHMVLLECLLAPDTNIPCNAELSGSIQKLIEEGGLQIQLNYLQQTAWQDKALNFASTKQPDPVNESKNRFNDIVPLENQIYISRYPIDDENSDYINAIPVDGFRFKEQFIVTQTPMPHTVKDFWRMVSEKSVKIIVCLNEIANDKTSCTFWPVENSEMKPVPHINLKHHKLQICDYYDLHSIILEDSSTQESFMMQLVLFKKWSHDNKLPKNEENLVMLWEEVENLSHGNYPMVITCYDGATASGFFVAMSFVIEKIKLEQQCDPCLAVRVVRRNRKQFVSNKTQFEFLYRSAVIYLSMFELYSNFQPVVNKQNN